MKIVEMLRRLTPGRALLLGLALAAFYYAILFDDGKVQKAAIDALTQQVADQHRQIATDQAKLDRAAVYKKTAAEVGTTIHKLLSVIPQHFSTQDLMKILSNEAKVAGTSLASIVPGTSQISAISKEFEELVVTIDMSGTFAQQMVFLSNLTKINQILILRKLDLTNIASTRAEDVAGVHLNAEIIAYRYSPAPPVAPATPAGAAAPAPAPPAAEGAGK